MAADDVRRPIYCDSRGCADPACGCAGPTETLTRHQDAALDVLGLREHAGVGGSIVSLPGFMWTKVDGVAAMLADRDRLAEERGYERGRRDFQFQPEGDNHHNAALCPYCAPGARAEAADGGGQT